MCNAASGYTSHSLSFLLSVMKTCYLIIIIIIISYTSPAGVTWKLVVLIYPPFPCPVFETRVYIGIGEGIAGVIFAVFYILALVKVSRK